MIRNPFLVATGAVCLLCAALLGACGKKGDPEPPIRLVPAPTTAMAVVQRGETLLIEFPYPQTTAAGTPLPRVSEVAVWMLVWRAPEPVAEEPQAPPEPVAGEPPAPPEPTAEEPRTPPEPVAKAPQAPPEVDERQFLAGARPVRVVTGDELPEVVRGDRIVVSLPVPAPPLEGAGRAMATVAVKTQGPTGVESAPSNRVSFPLIDPPAPPTGLEARDLAAGVRIRWEYPLAEGEAAIEEEEGGDETEEGDEIEDEPFADETEVEETEEADVEEGGLAGFNVYRRRSTERSYGEPLRTLGRRSRSFLDATAAFGERYIYTVTAVGSRRPVVVESRLAEEVEVDYRDRFSPPTPKGLVALAEAGRVRLVWEASDAPDLAGYRISRRGPDTQEFVPLTAEPITATEYADRDLAPGATYSYRVTAVDRLGNESRPSDAATATAR